MDRYAEASEQWTMELAEEGQPHVIDNIELPISMALASDETEIVLDR